MLIHNLKVAVRNLMKYKLQTLISILSIAIGIVTLSLAHSILLRYQLPDLYSQPYADRAYKVSLHSLDNGEICEIRSDILRAVKRDGGLRHAEKVAVHNETRMGVPVEFHLVDSTVRKGRCISQFIDPESLGYDVFYSAITGKRIDHLNPGEGIIDANLAKVIFKEKNPIGAVQTFIAPWVSVPITIVDVFQPNSLNQSSNFEAFYYCTNEDIEDFENLDNYLATEEIDVILSEGSAERQLLEEINLRVKPLGLETTLSKAVDQQTVNSFRIVRIIVYLLSSLILLAGVIGYLKIQLQLFRIRRRELALRVVNGATRMELFKLLATEVFISLGLATLISFFLSEMLERFITDNLIFISFLRVSHLWLYSIIIGSFLLVITLATVYAIINGILKAPQGLASGLRRNRNHFLRNAMLCIQISVSFLFVCSTFIFMDAAGKILDECNIPENDAFIKECLSLDLSSVSKREPLLEEIKHLPDLDNIKRWDWYFESVREFKEHPTARDSRPLQDKFPTYSTSDSTMLSILGLEVKWNRSDIERNRFILLSDTTYEQFKEFGLLDNGNVTIENWRGCETLPIAGTVRTMPYDRNDEFLIVVNQEMEKEVGHNYVLAPKPGKGKELALEVEEIIARFEPEIIDRVVFNYREDVNTMPTTVEAVRIGVIILGIVSLIICAMSILSTITLDTRARKKEVGIRKVNGAKGKDIFRLFGQVYIILVVIALAIAIPLSISFNRLITEKVADMYSEVTLSPALTIALGVLVVSLLIFLIVSWQIYKVMRIDPAEVIAKE